MALHCFIFWTSILGGLRHFTILAFPNMDFLRHPMETFVAWVERRRTIVKVRIDHPPMTIKGREILNKMCDPDYPTFFAFCGIPYAKPPVKKLRFQPPQPYSNFERSPKQKKEHKLEFFQCTQFTNVALQKIAGNEDCLYLNVYVSKNPKHMNSKLPVLVYIHGGGYEYGSGNISCIRPDNILRQNLVFVTINYRLSVFGFLNMGIESCRGNAGLKDQVQALKWIRDNIARFGGDPNNVTISGHSAGASCVNFHMISPLSKGLFHRAIVHAGGIYCPWGFIGNQNQVRALFAGKTTRTDLIETVVRYLKDKSPRDLLLHMQRFRERKCEEEPKRILVFMGPTLEPFSEDAFIPCDIEELKINAETVPLMAGICEGEGYLYIALEEDDTPFQTWVNNNKEFDSFLMENFRWSKETAQKYRDTLRNMYFPPHFRRTEEQVLLGFANFNTDLWFHRFYDNFKIGQIPLPYYVYQFCYLAEEHVTRQIGEGTIVLQKPTHGDEYHYLYSPDRFVDDVGELSVECKFIMDTMCSMLGNFCRMGGLQRSITIDEVQWRPHTERAPCYLKIDRTLALIRSRINDREWPILNQIVKLTRQVESPPITPTALQDYMSMI